MPEWVKRQGAHMLDHTMFGRARQMPVSTTVHMNKVAGAVFHPSGGKASQPVKKLVYRNGAKWGWG